MLKKIFLYSIYIIGIIIFFLYYLFPSDIIKKYIISKAKEANPNIIIRIDQVKPSFPPGLKFYKVEFLQEENPLADIENLKVMPNLMTLFKSEIRFTFKGESCKGTIKGKGSVVKSDNPDSVQGLMIDTDLSGIQIKDIKGIKTSDYKVSGILNGNILYNSKDPAETVVSKLSISDCNLNLAPLSKKMGLLAPLFNVGNFTFKNVDANITLNKSRTLQIKEFTVKGTQINGNLSGSVMLKTPSEKSMLNLTGDIKPHPSFIATLGNMGALINKANPGRGNDGGIPFKITGTIENPGFSLK